MGKIKTLRASTFETIGKKAGRQGTGGGGADLVTVTPMVLCSCNTVPAHNFDVIRYGTPKFMTRHIRAGGHIHVALFPLSRYPLQRGLGTHNVLVQDFVKVIPLFLKAQFHVMIGQQARAVPHRDVGEAFVLADVPKREHQQTQHTLFKATNGSTDRQRTLSRTSVP